MKKHIVIPVAAGSMKARAVHLRLPVSFLMVRQVVPHGKWKWQSISTQRAVWNVQPQPVRISCSWERLP